MEKLDEVLGITEKAVAVTSSTPLVLRSLTEDEDNDDFKYSRENLYHLIERGQDALDGILQVAKETDHPRAYEVAGQLLKTNADNAEKLVNLQTTKKKVTEVSGPKNVTNALFVGSTAELQKLIKGKNV